MVDYSAIARDPERLAHRYDPGADAIRFVKLSRRDRADTRLNDRLCSMIHEIDDGRRRLGFHNFDELEAYAETIGKALP